MTCLSTLAQHIMFLKTFQRWSFANPHSTKHRTATIDALDSVKTHAMRSLEQALTTSCSSLKQAEVVLGLIVHCPARLPT